MSASVQESANSVSRLMTSGVGVEKVIINQLISMKSEWQFEVFSSIV
jgi:hypothetical protein